MRTIPLPTSLETLVAQNVELDGKNFTLTFNWSARTNSWTLDIQDLAGAKLLSGAHMTPYVDLLRHVADDGRPGGELYIFPDSEAVPTRLDITRAILVYRELSDLS